MLFLLEALCLGGGGGGAMTEDRLLDASTPTTDCGRLESKAG